MQRLDRCYIQQQSFTHRTRTELGVGRGTCYWELFSCYTLPAADMTSSRGEDADGWARFSLDVFKLVQLVGGLNFGNSMREIVKIHSALYYLCTQLTDLPMKYAKVISEQIPASLLWVG